MHTEGNVCLFKSNLQGGMLCHAEDLLSIKSHPLVYLFSQFESVCLRGLLYLGKHIASGFLL